LDTALVAISLPVEDPQSVVIEGGDCYIRSEAGTNGKILGVAKRGSVHAYAGETSQTGWICIKHGGGIGWVSGKYGRLK
jgi:uncharacterized protein YraI